MIWCEHDLDIIGKSENSCDLLYSPDQQGHLVMVLLCISCPPLPPTPRPGHSGTAWSHARHTQSLSLQACEKAARTLRRHLVYLGRHRAFSQRAAHKGLPSFVLSGPVRLSASPNVETSGRGRGLAEGCSEPADITALGCCALNCRITLPFRNSIIKSALNLRV